MTEQASSLATRGSSHALVRPPGPRGLPWLGPLLALNRDTLGFLVEFGRNYGPIAHARIGPIHMYMVSEPSLIEELLIGRYAACVKDSTTRGLSGILGDGLITSDGALWKRQRRMASPAMRPKTITRQAGAAVTAAQRLIQRLPDDSQRNIYADMMDVLVEIASTSLLGFDATDSAECLHRVAQAAVEYTRRETFGVWQFLPQWLPARHRRAMRRASAELDAVVLRTIARCREQGHASDHYLGHLCHARDAEGQPMDARQLRDEAATILIAAHETTALVLTYALHSLATHPSAAARLRAELDGVLQGAPATPETLSQLPYLNAVIREVLRLYPSVQVFGRELIEPIDLGGYHLPAGSRVMMSPYVAQREPRYFPEPERFIPERWLQLDRSALPRFAYFPFGGGPRVCLGQHYAVMQMSHVLALVLQAFELEPVDGFRLRLEPILTLRPVDGYVPLRMRRRPQPTRTPVESRNAVAAPARA